MIYEQCLEYFKCHLQSETLFSATWKLKNNFSVRILLISVSEITTFLLFAEGSSLRQMALNATTSRRIPLKVPASKPIALDFDFLEEKVYWTDITLGTISRAYLNGSSQETVVRVGLNNPYGLAVDPFGRNIYWTDSTKQVIEIASTDGLYRRVLIKDNLQNPRDIILDVTRGYTSVSHSLCDCFKDYSSQFV